MTWFADLSKLDRQFALRLLEMVESKLLTYRHLKPWVDRLIAMFDDTPPGWICDLATKKFQPDLAAAIREFACSEPFEAATFSEHYRVACFFLRFKRREMSWAWFLRESGIYTDAVNGELHCEYFYELLNELEDSDDSEAVERNQVRQVEAEFSETIAKVSQDMDTIIGPRA